MVWTSREGKNTCGMKRKMDRPANRTGKNHEEGSEGTLKRMANGSVKKGPRESGKRNK